MYILASICILILIVALGAICQQKAIRRRTRTELPANDNLKQNFVYKVGKRRPRKR
jgi:hypothetical protein